ncbi:MAG: VCBS repeat-containing protein [Acidobacteriia bacterium]|nr:VCBS repeat-containing protein [Terriglobia bacterium]
MVAGDLNGDGISDVIGFSHRGNINSLAFSVVVLLGNGDGTFRLPINSDTRGGSVSSAAVGDFNGDGKVDLVLIENGGSIHFQGPSTVSIWLGKGDGAFQSPLVFVPGSILIYVAVADFNKDNKLDLAVVSFTGVSIILGKGDGTFQPSQDIGIVSSPKSLAAGDFNGDGKTDLAVATTSEISILLGKGDGTFQPGSSFLGGSSFDGLVATGDFNGDGKTDLAASKASVISVLLSNGDGTFQAPVIDLATAGLSPFVTADFDGDGKTDLAGINQFTKDVSVLWGNGDGTFKIGPTLSAAVGGRSLISGDFNGDGQPDLAAFNSSLNNLYIDLSTCLTPKSSVTLAVTAGGSGTLSTLGRIGNVEAGYATVDTNSGSAPYGVAVFSLVQNGVVVSEAGVPASPPTLDARIFIDYRNVVPSKSNQESSGAISVNTGLAVVNLGTNTAQIALKLRDSQGKVLASGAITLPSKAHLANFITELAPGLVVPPNFPTEVGFGSLEITSEEPMSIVALRLTTNQQSETLLTTTPIADLTKAPSQDPLSFPQLVDGGGYRTTLVLLNTSEGVETGNLKIFSDSGSPLSVNAINGSSGSSFPYLIPPEGVFIFQTDGSPQFVNAGSVQLTPDSGTTTPVGAGIFSLRRAGNLVTESGIPSANLTTHARLYVDLTNRHNTGVAIAIAGSVPLHASITAFEADGITPVATGSLDLDPNGHAAKFANQFFIASLPEGFTGVLDVTSLPTIFLPATPFAALTLRSLSATGGDFLLTTFPIADVNQPAPSPMIFPQIAAGGGFTTQFILLSATGGASTTLNFFGDDGSSMAVGKNAR